MVSFNIDTTTLLSNAATMFNALWPLFAILLGLTLGIGILKFVGKLVGDIF